MKAKIKDITLGREQVNIQVDFFYSPEEVGYDECYREITIG